MREELLKRKRQKRRALRIRKKILFAKTAPRLSVFRSNKHVHAQIIDDKKGVTLVSVSEAAVKSDAKLNKSQMAEAVGSEIAKQAISKKIKTVVFDKGSYRYHGRIKALAEAARKEGLVF